MLPRNSDLLWKRPETSTENKTPARSFIENTFPELSKFVIFKFRVDASSVVNQYFDLMSAENDPTWDLAHHTPPTQVLLEAVNELLCVPHRSLSYFHLFGPQWCYNLNFIRNSRDCIEFIHSFSLCVILYQQYQLPILTDDKKISGQK